MEHVERLENVLDMDQSDSDDLYLKVSEKYGTLSEIKNIHFGWCKK